jgi:hypothetical protein
MLTAKFSLNNLAFHNLTNEQKEQILNYKLMIYFCEGSDLEKLNWFKVINIAGEKLTDQELRNAVYTGTWLTEAKAIFSKSNCAAFNLSKDYVFGSPIRQEILQIALMWKNKGDIEGYMSAHQLDPNANELWAYFRNVIEWIELTFTVKRKEMKGINWGNLYDEFHNETSDAKKLEQEIKTLMADDDITNKKGIYPYILNRNTKFLNIRSFADNQRRSAYEKSGGICAKCGKHFEFEDMQADHIKPWSKGGKTSLENCRCYVKTAIDAKVIYKKEMK